MSPVTQDTLPINDVYSFFFRNEVFHGCLGKEAKRASHLLHLLPVKQSKQMNCFINLIEDCQPRNYIPSIVAYLPSRKKREIYNVIKLF